MLYFCWGCRGNLTLITLVEWSVSKSRDELWKFESNHRQPSFSGSFISRPPPPKKDPGSGWSRALLTNTIRWEGGREMKEPGMEVESSDLSEEHQTPKRFCSKTLKQSRMVGLDFKTQDISFSKNDWILVTVLCFLVHRAFFLHPPLPWS